MRPEGNENYEAIISELKKIADDYDKATSATEMKEAIDRLKSYIPDKPTYTTLEDLVKPSEDGFDRNYRKYSAASNADEIINISDFSISPRFVADDYARYLKKIQSFSIVHDRTKLEECVPPSTKVIMSTDYGTYGVPFRYLCIPPGEPCRANRDPYVRPMLYSQWLKQMMMRAYGYKAGIINYFPRSIGLSKIGCSWWWQKLMYRRLASILCGDYYTPYDTSEVNLDSVIFMSTYEALPKAVKRGCITLDSMNAYGPARPAHIFIESFIDISKPSYGKYLDNLEIKWPWSPFVSLYGRLAVETPSSKLKEALSKNETHDKNVSTKHRKR